MYPAHQKYFRALKTSFLCFCLPVSQQLINRIDQFLESKGWQYYRKSIDCIQVFREEAIKVMVMSENCLNLGNHVDMPNQREPKLQ